MKQTGIVSLYKPKGVTPYQLIESFRLENPAYSDSVIGYAGRLDPLAHGVMLLMVGETTKERDNYLSLPKSYTVEALLDVETDTYDVLGIPLAPFNKGGIRRRGDLERSITHFLLSHVGTQQQEYPPYSSKAVNGKPLHWWAKNNNLTEITIPTHEVTITKLMLTKMQEKPIDVIADDIFRQIASVKGDFRQDAIKERWEEFFQQTNRQSMQTATITIDCSSGTYVRQLTHELGQELGRGAITLDILRTRVGDYYLPLTHPSNNSHT